MRSLRTLVSITRRARGRPDYSTSTSNHISQWNGPWSFGSQPYIKLDDHFQRLIIPTAAKPYQVLKHSDRIIQTGYEIVHQSNMIGVSTEFCWIKENVHVFPKMGSFALKEVDLSNIHELTPEEKKRCFLAYNSFLKEVISETHGPQAVMESPTDILDIDRLIQDLDKDENLAELIVYNAAFLPPRTKAILYMIIYNILVQRLPTLINNGLPVPGFVPTSQFATAQDLLAELMSGVAYTDEDPENEPWGTVIAQRNLPIFSVWATATSMSRDDAIGILRLLRVGVCHPLEEAMVKAIINIANNGITTLNSLPPSFDEIVLFFDYYLPRVAPKFARKFYNCGVYGWLKIPKPFHRLQLISLLV